MFVLLKSIKRLFVRCWRTLKWTPERSTMIGSVRKQKGTPGHQRSQVTKGSVASYYNYYNLPDLNLKPYVMDIVFKFNTLHHRPSVQKDILPYLMYILFTLLVYCKILTSGPSVSDVSCSGLMYYICAIYHHFQCIWLYFM